MASRVAGQLPHRARGDQRRQGCRDREADREEVERRHPIEQVADQEERAPQMAVTTSRASAASSVVRRSCAVSPTSDEEEGDRATPRDHRPGRRVDAEDVADAEVVSALLEFTSKPRASAARCALDTEATRPPGTSTSSGPCETTSVTVSPRNRVPLAGGLAR